MRKLLSAMLCAAVLLLVGCNHEDHPGDQVVLPRLKDHYRVIAVFPQSHTKAIEMTNAFKSSPGIRQRDIAWFVVGPDKIASNLKAVPSRKRLEKLHTVHAFQAVLLGKNGKLTASQLGSLDIQGLFDAIDQLPSAKQLQQGL